MVHFTAKMHGLARCLFNPKGIVWLAIGLIATPSVMAASRRVTTAAGNAIANPAATAAPGKVPALVMNDASHPGGYRTLCSKQRRAGSSYPCTNVKHRGFSKGGAHARRNQGFYRKGHQRKR